MGELINFIDYQAKIEKEFNGLMTSIEEKARENNRTLEDELAELCPIEQEYYNHLTKTLEVLELWEKSEQRRLKNENSTDRQDAKRQRFGR
ncbi:hypothetical protein Dtox_1884 [Desulfofarcimen acetoxidans DSM 771]|uniref:Uncharacterized protein n=1 Tax=Desulfofarcimen acetoxidans (strain ATCC 49208 / DSM 771 / KCTC 5769 / VKM B-1644 / 5575) TaxID=485916 RepID=C8VXS4_DESAS|nr:hypothetical protein [Desulfofarcimen acetoxidans]ACV62730.1 hypothetical protein Dtox_1884 [Desulfofarcimen acetoxidans DSM 771]